MTFLDLIKAWNGGIERGSKRRFAKAVGVEEVSVGRWVNGRGMPDESVRPKVAKLLGVTVEDLMSSLKAGRQLPSGVAMGDVEYAKGETMHIPLKEPPGQLGGVMTLILGRLDQLTKQVADLQERCGVLDYQLKEVKAKVESPREPEADKTPHEGGGTPKKK